MQYFSFGKVISSCMGLEREQGGLYGRLGGREGKGEWCNYNLLNLAKPYKVVSPKRGVGISTPSAGQ